jgi:hypothetical protein
MKDGLGMNAALERLELKSFILTENSDLWCRSSWCMAFSFLRSSKFLKSLVIDLHDDYLEYDVTKACFSTLVCDILAMLKENASLESLSIRTHDSRIRIKAKDHRAPT